MHKLKRLTSRDWEAENDLGNFSFFVIEYLEILTYKSYSQKNKKLQKRSWD